MPRKHIIDPIIDEKRQLEREARHRRLDADEKTLKGINPIIRKSIPAELRKVAAEGKKKKYGKALTLHHQAEKLDELAGRWTDHYMSAWLKAEEKDRSEISDKEWHERWGNTFDGFLEKMVRKLPIENIDAIIGEVDAMHEYTRLPHIVWNQRKRRWKKFETMRKKLLDQKVNPEINLLESTRKTVARSMSRGGNSAARNKLKAIDICVACSIYADLKVELEHKTDGTNWTRHYRNGIHLIWESANLPDGIATAIKNLER